MITFLTKPDVNVVPGLCGLCVLYTTHNFVAGIAGYYTSEQAEVFWNLSAGVLWAWWVVNDASRRGIHRPFEFGTFIFFAWPLAVPLYMFWVHGWRGFIGVVWLAAFAATPYIAGEGAYLLYGE